MDGSLTDRVVLTRDRWVILDGQEIGLVFGTPGEWSSRLHSGYRSKRFLDYGHSRLRFAALECARAELERREQTSDRVRRRRT